MSFTDSVRTCFQKYVTFSGRAARSEFWWWVLFILIANFILGLIDGMVFGFSADGTGGPLGAVFALATLLPSISVAVRRLHDRDMSGWWLLIGLIPLLGFLVLLYFFVQRGTDGSNRFGPDPLNPVADDDGPSFTHSSIPRTSNTE